MSTEDEPRIDPAPDVIKPVAVVLGCPRSGSTYLMAALSTLPRTACLSGQALPIGLLHVLANPPPEPSFSALASEIPISLDRHLRSGAYNSRTAAVTRWWRSDRGVASVLDALRGRDRADRLVFKEPFLSFIPGLVLEMLPEAPVVNLIRDGRDSANSLVRSFGVLTDERLADLTQPEMPLGYRVSDDDPRYVPWWVPDGEAEGFLESSPFIRSVMMWREMVDRCDDAFATADDRVLDVPYEGLVRDPDAWANRIAYHLGATPSSRYRQQLRTAHVRSIGAYRSRSPDEIAVANRVAGPTLERHGFATG